jgi:hypothetical protein
MLEMGESLSIITQTAVLLLNNFNSKFTDKIEEGYNVISSSSNSIIKKKNNYYNYMEDLIEHFLL